MAGLEIITSISVLFLLMTMVSIMPLFAKNTANNKNTSRYVRIFPALFMIIAFCSFFNDKIGWGIVVVLLISVFVSSIVLPLSFMKNTQILNRIYFALFFILFLFFFYLFMEDKDMGSTFNFLSFFISFFISFLMYLFLRKWKREIALWSLSFNIEVLILMLYQYVFYKKIEQAMWYYIPLLFVSVFMLTSYILSTCCKKKKETNA